MVHAKLFVFCRTFRESFGFINNAAAISNKYEPITIGNINREVTACTIVDDLENKKTKNEQKKRGFLFVRIVDCIFFINETKRVKTNNLSRHDRLFRSSLYFEIVHSLDYA